jgi:hypothetical protein
MVVSRLPLVANVATSKQTQKVTIDNLRFYLRWLVEEELTNPSY